MRSARVVGTLLPGALLMLPAPNYGEREAKMRFVRDSEASVVKRKPLDATQLVPTPPETEPCTRLVKASRPASATLKVPSNKGKRWKADWASQLHSRAAKRRRLSDKAEAYGQALSHSTG